MATTEYATWVDPERPYILLTNDDGVSSPALAALASEVSRIGQVVVLAPDHNWSAAGHTKTMHKPLRVSPTELASGMPALATSGSPSDCVAFTVLGLLGTVPALVVSGINQGANVGHDLTYSGTVAAAMEAHISGIPALAVSLDSYAPVDPEPAARFASRLCRTMLEQPSEHPLLLNVNVPALGEGEIAGVRLTRLGQRVYRDALLERHDPRGRSYYWIGGDPPSGLPLEGTDIGALAEGCVSVTPIQLDLTDQPGLEALADWPLWR